MTSEAETPDPIRIGLLAAEPIRVAGLASIFDLPAEKGQARLIPVIGTMPELTAMADIEYLVVDLHSSKSNLQLLETVRLTRPDLRLIVIGPEGNDELIMSSIVAGARGYLGLSAGPEIIRKAIDVVTSGSIWAPRPILSRLIDRLLKVPKVTKLNSGPQLTPREEQVLELIVKAHSTREIASRLGIEQRTVKAYIGRLMRKTGADNRIKLSMSTLGRSLLSQEGVPAREKDVGGTVTKQ
jgi:DNA-binding NarL/FixJ family response regulator